MRNMQNYKIWFWLARTLGIIPNLVLKVVADWLFGMSAQFWINSIWSSENYIKKKNIILEKSFNFSVSVVNYVKFAQHNTVINMHN